jgi:hypothetical protein
MSGFCNGAICDNTGLYTLPSEANKIDTYSLGITLVKLLKYINYDMKNKKINEFLRNIIHPDFEKRYSPKQAIQYLKLLLR